MIPYTRKYYLDTIEKGVKKLLSSTSIPTGQLEEMALPPCHCLFQFYVAQGKLSCQLYQRSADIFLGVPFKRAKIDFISRFESAATGASLGK